MIINLFDNHFEDHTILEIVYVSPSYSSTLTIQILTELLITKFFQVSFNYQIKGTI